MPTALPGVLIIEPDVFRDGRGFFLETYHEALRARRDPTSFVQDNHSRRWRGRCADCTSSGASRRES